MSRKACYASDIENPELGTPSRLIFWCRFRARPETPRGRDDIATNPEQLGDQGSSLRTLKRVRR